MTATFVEERYKTVKKISIDWVSDSAGVATGTTENVYDGLVERLVTVPDGAALAPSASYDITLSDQDSTDVLMGAGANRHSANTEQVLAASLGVVAYDTLTVNVAGAGASNAGSVYVYIR